MMLKRKKERKMDAKKNVTKVTKWGFTSSEEKISRGKIGVNRFLFQVHPHRNELLIVNSCINLNAYLPCMMMMVVTSIQLWFAQNLHDSVWGYDGPSMTIREMFDYV